MFVSPVMAPQLIIDLLLVRPQLYLSFELGLFGFVTNEVTNLPDFYCCNDGASVSSFLIELVFAKQSEALVTSKFFWLRVLVGPVHDIL